MSGVHRSTAPSALILLTSFLDKPVIAATREMFVGRPRSPYSSLAACTKTAFVIAINSGHPNPHLNISFAKGSKMPSSDFSTVC